MSEDPRSQGPEPKKPRDFSTLATLAAAFVQVLTVVSLAIAITVSLPEATSVVFPRHEDYARQIADQYYVLLTETPQEEEARRVRRQLLELSLLDFSQTSEPGQVEPAIKCKVVEGECTEIGLNPDQIVYAKSDSADDMWIVGLDLDAGQGDLHSTSQKLKETQEIFTALVLEVSAESSDGRDTENERKIVASLDEAQQLMAGAKIKFFDALDYESRHGNLGRLQ